FRIDMEIRTVAPAEEHRGEPIALIAAAGIQILAGRLSAEDKAAGRIPRLRVVQKVLPDLGARLDVVAPQRLGHRARKLMHTLLSVYLPVTLCSHVRIAAGAEGREDM